MKCILLFLTCYDIIFFCLKFYFEKIILFTTHNTNKFVEYTKYLIYIYIYIYKLLDPQVTKQYTK